MQVKKVTLSVPKPQVDIAKSVREITGIILDSSDKFIEFLFSVIIRATNILKRKLRQRGRTESQIRPINKYSETKRRKIDPRILRISKILLLIGITLIVVVGLGRLVGGIRGTSSSSQASVSDAKASQMLNLESSFPLRDSEGDEVSTIKYVIEKAELRDQIIVQGQRATAIKGRIFLILTLKISNEYDQPIEIDTRDYVRLSVDGDEVELLAPDIHNDPVEVQAISTKFTRVGFPIDDDFKSLVLRVGEISGGKEKVVLELN